MFENLFNQQISGTSSQREGATDRPLRATILQGSEEFGTELYVHVETLGENARRGPCVWEPIVGDEGEVFLPAGGEECSVQFDSNGLPWILSWVPDAGSHVVHPTPAAGSITEAMLANEAVGTGKIKNLAVTAAKIALGAIGLAQLAEGFGVEPGELRATARAAAPGGWLLCQGQAVSRETFAALFAAIGTTYGAGNGSTTFNVPNGEGRVMIGSSGTHARGTTGGAETVVLTSGQMPKHKHTDSGHTHGPLSGGNFVQDGEGAGTKLWGTAGKAVLDAATTASGTAVLSETGNNEAHTNLQPYFVGNWMIKT